MASPDGAVTLYLIRDSETDRVRAIGKPTSGLMDQYIWIDLFDDFGSTSSSKNLLYDLGSFSILPTGRYYRMKGEIINFEDDKHYKIYVWVGLRYYYASLEEFLFLKKPGFLIKEIRIFGVTFPAASYFIGLLFYNCYNHDR